MMDELEGSQGLLPERAFEDLRMVTDAVAADLHHFHHAAKPFQRFGGRQHILDEGGLSFDLRLAVFRLIPKDQQIPR